MDWNHFDLSKQAEKWNNGEAKWFEDENFTATRAVRKPNGWWQRVFLQDYFGTIFLQFTLLLTNVLKFVENALQCYNNFQKQMLLQT